MNRRDAVLALLGVATAPASGWAQQRRKVWRIAVVTPAGGDPVAADTNAHAAAFVTELQAAGFGLGVDYVIESLAVGGDRQAPQMIAGDLSRLGVDIVVPVTPIAVSAACAATKSLPIVGVGMHDPVGAGLAASLARPGGNLTGMASFYGELIPKHFELLRSIAPKVTRVGLLFNAKVDRDAKLEARIVEATEKLGLRRQFVAVDGPQQLPQAFASLARERAGAVVAVADVLFYAERAKVAELALKYRLPSFFPNRENVQAGGLLSYGEDFVEMFAHAAKFVGKIMKGAKPGDLPIEQPTKFQLAINRKTAGALKLSLPQELLLRADEIIG